MCSNSVPAMSSQRTCPLGRAGPSTRIARCGREDPVDTHVVLGGLDLDVDNLTVMHDVDDLGRLVCRAEFGQERPLEVEVAMPLADAQAVEADRGTSGHKQPDVAQVRNAFKSSW